MAVLFARLVAHRNFWRVMLTAAGAWLLIGAWMGYYNFRVTGSPVRMPFVEYSAQYDVYPKFWFLPARPPPPYRNDVMRRLHTDWERGDYDRMRTMRGICAVASTRLWQFIAINTQPLVLLIPLLAAVALGRNPRFRWVWLAMGVFLAGILAEAWLLPHYAAPAIPVVLLLIVAGWQWLGEWRPGNTKAGQILGFAIFCGFLVGVIGWVAQQPRPSTERFGRVNLIASTQLRNGRHLVFVRYLPGHLLDDEWVYNAADLEHSDVIWARMMGESDIPLIRTFRNRQVWLLEVGKDDLSLNPYLTAR
jgi:hypothetical protein